MEKIKAKLLGKNEIQRSIVRLAYEIIEKNSNLECMVLIGIRTRGEYLAQRLHKLIKEYAGISLPLGTLDVTFYRDDFRTNLGSPKIGASNIFKYVADGIHETSSNCLQRVRHNCNKIQENPSQGLNSDMILSPKIHLRASILTSFWVLCRTLLGPAA